MFKKLFAILLMQFYLSAALGVTLGQAWCCEESGGMLELMECHAVPDEGAAGTSKSASEPTSCEHHPAPATPGDNTTSGDNSTPGEDCCPDCESFYFSVQKENLTEPNHTQNVTSLTTQKLQAISIALPWIVDYYIITLSQGSTYPPESPRLASANEVPIFIRDCTYRI